MKYCPHCGGDISPYIQASGMSGTRQPAAASIKTKDTKYDQDEVWRRIQRSVEVIRESPPRPEMLVMAAHEALSARPPGSFEKTVVHFAFDRPIVPVGGVLHRMTLLNGRAETTPEQLQTMGYALADGKVRVVDGVPVGPSYTVLEYWGGERQYRRWHLLEPIKIEPSRNGNPFFMDDNMIAFGAKWKDLLAFQEGLLELTELFSEGLPGEETIAIPLALEIL